MSFEGTNALPIAPALPPATLRTTDGKPVPRALLVHGQLSSHLSLCAKHHILEQSSDMWQVRFQLERAEN